ncbi:hypothetical protein OIV83_003810 [Microbotryomycetes sp. JL201]|nr:hypothetical protein OIV83_003810 [Microbotryomycetes sp. JL201]
MSTWLSPAAWLVRLAGLSLLHAAYSAWLVRQTSQLTGKHIEATFGSPVPRDILLQAVLSAFLCLVGIIWSATPLKDIAWSTEMNSRSIDSETSRLTMRSMRHRGQVLFPDRDA